MDIHDYADKNRLSARSIMDFTNLVNPLGPSTKAKNAIRKHVKGLSIPADKKARYLAAHIARRESIEKNSILFGTGTEGVIDTILAAMAIKSVVIPGPIPEIYRDLAARHDITIREIIPRGEDPLSIDVEALADRLREADGLIIPQPHPLTGASLSEETLSMFISRADEAGITLIIDESLRDYTALSSPVAAVCRSRKAVIVRTFSSYYGLAGLPMGYALGPAHIIEKASLHTTPSAINSLAIEAALASLRDGVYRTRTGAFVTGEKEFFLKTLASLEGVDTFDTPCSFLLISFHDTDNDDRFRALCARYRILIDDAFEIDGTAYLRVPVKQHKWNARFLKTLRNCLGAVKS